MLKRAPLLYGLLALLLLVSACNSALFVKRYTVPGTTFEKTPDYSALKLQRFRQFQLLEKHGSNHVITGGRWKKVDGELVLHKKRQRGFDPFPSRWVSVTELNWRTYQVQGDSLIRQATKKVLVRERK